MTAVTPERKALDAFGRLLVQDVRDRTIVDWDMIVDGKMKGDRATKVRALLSKLSPEQTEVLKTILPSVVDMTLHHLCFALEQQDLKQDEVVTVGVKVDGRVIPNVAEVSDGLAGELPAWIPAMSKRRYGTLDGR